VDVSFTSAEEERQVDQQLPYGNGNYLSIAVFANADTRLHYRNAKTQERPGAKNYLTGGNGTTRGRQIKKRRVMTASTITPFEKLPVTFAHARG